MCAVPIHEGVTRFDIEAEIPQSIDFQIEVPEEHANLLRGEGSAAVVRVEVDPTESEAITLNVATSGTATVGRERITRYPPQS